MCALASGDRLTPRFSLIRPLGRTGGRVWIVRDDDLDEEVVAKILPHDASEEAVALLLKECRQARRLIHPNIVRVFDFHRGEGCSFITMERVEGEDLTSLRGRSTAEIVEVMIPVADALAYAHGMGVVHRDLKATNVVRDRKGQPQLLDFGIAETLGDREGAVLAGGGSRNNVSPQQLDGQEPRPADDLYAFGALLFDLITGGPLFGMDITDDDIRFSAPEAMRSSYPVPERLRSLVTSLLAKDPDGRPARMTDVVEELTNIRGALEAAPTPRAPDKTTLRVTPPPKVTAVGSIGPREPAAPERPLSRPGRAFWITTAVIAALGLVAVSVFVFLPQWAAANRTGEPSRPLPPRAGPVAATSDAETSGDTTQPPNPEDLRAQAHLEERAEEALDRAMSLQEGLEERDVAVWGGDDWRRGVEFLGAGDRHLSAMEYAEADRNYRQAADRFESLEAMAPGLFRDAIRDGRQALADDDAAGATAAFRLAATIAPNSREAISGLERAEVLDRVVALLDSGAEVEGDGDFRRAEELYREAVTLDSLSFRAQESLARVQARISNDDFARAMSEGLAALENGEYATARAAFKRAAAVQPGSTQVAGALVQVEQREKLDIILGHRDRALAFEASESWHEAVVEYDAVLKIDATIRFAQEGRQRCATLASITDRIDFHLANPGRLSWDEVFDEATVLLEEAKAVSQPAAGLKRRINQLDRLLEVSATPVRVALESDDLTEVTVYRVGRLGKFTRRELVLRPGTYTVVGSRQGYRDVRRKLVVLAGIEPTPLMVRCEEPI